MKKWAILLLFIGACDDKPKHYYVLCGDKDDRGWNLISSAKDDNGYLISCTYQAPDKSDAYTARCTAQGCG